MKTFLISIFILLLSFSANAQKVDLGKITVGAFVGTNLSTYAMQTAQPESSTRFGYQLGAYFRYGERLYLHSGLSWYRVSVKLSEALPLPRESRVGVNLIQVPLLLGLKVYEQRDKGRTFRIQAGPAASVLTGVNENDLQYSGDDFSNLWFGALAGVGVDVWILTLDAGYQWGLNDTFSNNAAEGTYRMATFSIGIRL